MKIEVKTNFAQVQARLDRLQADVGGRALASAINKTMDQAKTQMAREIVREFVVTSSYVKDRLRIQRASFKSGRLVATAALLGGDGRKRSANIIRFVERSTTLAEGRRRAKAGTLNQIFVKVKRGSAKKALMKGAFIGNKGRTVFVREGKERYPFKPVQVIDVGQMFNARRINSVVVAKIKAKFPEIFEREARYFTQRFSGGRA